MVNPVISRCEPSFRGPQRRNISIPLLERRGGERGRGVGGGKERKKGGKRAGRSAIMGRGGEV